ncbi:hypothetical protein R4J03_06200 [Brachyspira intermedia]
MEKIKEISNVNDLEATLECVTGEDSIIDCAPGCCSPINSD